MSVIKSPCSYKDMDIHVPVRAWVLGPWYVSDLVLNLSAIIKALKARGIFLKTTDEALSTHLRNPAQSSLVV